MYKKALEKYISQFKEEEGRYLFWKLFDELFDGNDKEECAKLVSYLAEAVKDEN